MKNSVIIFVVGIFIVVLSDHILATTIHVPADYQTIQAGIDAAMDGDTVLVADGIYTGDGNRDLIIEEKEITLASEHGPESTMIDCQAIHNQDEHFAIKITHQETAESILDGLTIQGACFSDLGAILIYGSSAVIRNCVVTDNHAPWQGGGFNIGGGITQHILIQGCTISNNSAGYMGGGVFTMSNGLIKFVDCIIQNNSAGDQNGGGVLAQDCDLVIENCLFTGNDTGFVGGAICHSYGNVSINNCNISDNIAGIGGGIFLQDASGVIESSLFSGNTSRIEGGAISTLRTPIVINKCTISNNDATRDGGGIQIESESELIHCSISNCVIAHNDCHHAGGGIFLQSRHENINIEITNCSIYNNQSSQGENLYSDTVNLIVQNSIVWGSDHGIDFNAVQPVICYSIIQNGYDGICNSESDPLFVGGSPFDFHLLPDSPCIDTGTLEDAPETDLDGKPRPNGTGIDIGAYEFYWPTNIQTFVMMPSRQIETGDLSYCKSVVWNPNEYSLDHYNLFVMLDALGPLFMAPSFSEFDYYRWSFKPGKTDVIILPEFDWPSGMGSATGIRWYGALVNPELTELVGGMGIFDFGWSE